MLSIRLFSVFTTIFFCDILKLIINFKKCCDYMCKNTNSNSYNITRRSAREQAFILLFEMSFSDSEFSLEQIKENAMDSRDVVFCEYAVKVAQGFDKNKTEIDGIISTHLKKGWKISRISRVSLAVLRLAIYEMKYEEKIPHGVSINEAVELSKKFSIDESGFVNGILGAVSRDLEKS